MSLPTPSPADLSRQAPLPAPVLRAVAAAAIMALGLGIGMLATHGLAGAADGFATRLVPAALVTLVVVPAILLLRRRWDRRRFEALGLGAPMDGAKSLALGIGIVGGCGAAGLAVASFAGGIAWGRVDVPALLAFLAVNAVIALLLEALPEELSIRGYALAALRSRYGRAASAWIATALFMAVPAVLLLAQGLLTRWLGGGAAIPLAPGDDGALLYYGTLAAFSAMLIFAREATLGASIWTCVGAHLAFLTVNRILLGVPGTGVELETSAGVRGFVFAAYVTAAIVAFALLRDRADARRRVAGAVAGSGRS
ncbi:type II CAAX prenyl endopeptidase Rce1 family protein [Coralloluteibacterium thermophilus]|uniref:Type II CAAX prenyl endopeptidase Rce1 family protein n=1 Tax=Coralloluteibacterium thermophilum TaxID=2707049 RepID=A0ABV9NET8_9GAMM